MKEPNQYEQFQITKINEWENKKPSVLAKSINTVFIPVSWVAEKIIPRKLIQGALSSCNAAGAWLADKGDILRDGNVNHVSELKTKDLELSDKLADEVHNYALGIATAEGGATGFGGLSTMCVDIPALITLAYRTIHKIGLCYGYECKSYEDRMFVNMIFQAASSNTVKEKATALITLKQIEVLIAKNTWKNIALKAAENKLGHEALIMFVKNSAKSVGKNMTKRKALQSIPIVGSVVGAGMNASFIQDVAWAARRLFQRRWLIDNEKLIIENN